jgi:tRNA G18 (ribose-2'-O)-methylase SpoU
VVVPILNAADPRLDDYRNIPDPELLRRRGIFIAEGRHVVRRLLESARFRTRSLLLTPAAHVGLIEVLPHTRDVPIYLVEQEVMNEVSGFNMHRGCLAVGERPRPLSWRDVVRDARLVVVLERVSNADNVGGIFRNAAAFGADAVLLGPGCADPLYRKAIRTSMAAALRVPFAMLDDWPADLEQLRAAGFTLIALTPIAKEPLSAPLLFRRQGTSGGPGGAVAEAGRAALLLGHEGEGLSRDSLELADIRARIPMADGVDSLNVATAAAIALYEWSRR